MSNMIYGAPEVCGERACARRALPTALLDLHACRPRSRVVKRDYRLVTFYARVILCTEHLEAFLRIISIIKIQKLMLINH